MAWLLTTLQEHYAGADANAWGESLERSWDGAEIGFLPAISHVYAAVAAAEAKDWIFGVHHPLYAGGPRTSRHLPLLSADPAARAGALAAARQAAFDARAIGARWILFHFPYPARLPDRLDLAACGWETPPAAEPESAWTDAAVKVAARTVLEALAESAARTGLDVVLELDGPHAPVYEQHLLPELLADYPHLSLCLDTARLNVLARTHRADPGALTAAWLPWLRHLHLSESRVQPGAPLLHHVPARPGLARGGGWAGAAEIAAAVVAAQPRCRVVLEHRPGLATAAELEECHAWARQLVRRPWPV